MMGAETREAIQREYAEKSEREGKTPLIIEKHDITSAVKTANACYHVPFLGDYVPNGFRYLDVTPYVRPEHIPQVYQDHLLFVDSSGMGMRDEPALNIKELQEVFQDIHKGVGDFYVGIWETGQFQVRLAVFEREEIK